MILSAKDPGVTINYENLSPDRPTIIIASGGKTIEITYNDMGYYKSLRDTDVGNAMIYQYNVIGKHTQMTDPDAGTLDYTYNTVGQLKNLANANNTLISYTRLNQIFSENNSDRIIKSNYCIASEEIHHAKKIWLLTIKNHLPIIKCGLTRFIIMFIPVISKTTNNYIWFGYKTMIDYEINTDAPVKCDITIQYNFRLLKKLNNNDNLELIAETIVTDQISTKPKFFYNRSRKLLASFILELTKNINTSKIKDLILA